MVEALRFRVTEAEAGERLDRLLVRRVAGLGRREAGELCGQGKVLVNGRPARKAAHARAGDEVCVEREPAIRADRTAPLVVRRETEHYVIVAKPAGLPSVPNRRGEAASLAALLLGHYPELRAVGHRPSEPGLIHRLDTHTSGLLLAARTPLGFDELSAALRAGAIDKRYLAVTLEQGLPEAGDIALALAPERRGSPRVAAAAGAPRVTRYRVVERRPPWALVELRVSRAYRHQVRAHLALSGHPIAGDALYGGPRAPELGPERHALHASALAWRGTARVPGFDLEEPLPDDMRRLLSG